MQDEPTTPDDVIERNVRRLVGEPEWSGDTTDETDILHRLMKSAMKRLMGPDYEWGPGATRALVYRSRTPKRPYRWTEVLALAEALHVTVYDLVFPHDDEPISIDIAKAFTFGDIDAYSAERRHQTHVDSIRRQVIREAFNHHPEVVEEWKAYLDQATKQFRAGDVDDARATLREGEKAGIRQVGELAYRPRDRQSPTVERLVQEHLAYVERGNIPIYGDKEHAEAEGAVPFIGHWSVFPLTEDDALKILAEIGAIAEDYKADAEGSA